MLEPAQPCRLRPAASDPPPSAGLSRIPSERVTFRGAFALPALPGRTIWNFACRTDLGRRTSTRRPRTITSFVRISLDAPQGTRAGITYATEMGRRRSSYSLGSPFQSALSPSPRRQPVADGNGNIHLSSGQPVPGIPCTASRSARLQCHPGWTPGGVLTYVSDLYFRGDE